VLNVWPNVFKALADPTRAQPSMSWLSATTRHSSSSAPGSRRVISWRRRVRRCHNIDGLANGGVVTTRHEGRYEFHRVDRAPLRQVAVRRPAPPWNRLRELGVHFTQEPLAWATSAVFDDTCGSLIQISTPPELA
jgi:hypothetical protein